MYGNLMVYFGIIFVKLGPAREYYSATNRPREKSRDTISECLYYIKLDINHHNRWWGYVINLSGVPLEEVVIIVLVTANV